MFGKLLLILAGCMLSVVAGCAKGLITHETPNSGAPLRPVVVTDMTPNDTDDPAIWINPQDPMQSIIIGTDKDANGGLYAFDLNGRIIKEKTVQPLQRPNNVDVEYGLQLAGETLDIAVTTERNAHKLRVFRLPEMTAIDGGGLDVFTGESGKGYRAPMGIALYKRPADGAVFAMISRKSGPAEGYLWQYLLHDNGSGQLTATLVRKFGTFSGTGQIEAIAVDDALGYVYYSDELAGVRKYHADPAQGNQELALFATNGFLDEREGISIYQETPETGYILVSDQSANRFHIFPRQGTAGHPNNHPLLSIINLSTEESDGSDVVSIPLGAAFPEGLFVAMSTNRTFQYYSWKDIANAAQLK